MNGNLVDSLLKDGQTIADIGSGISPAPWWSKVGVGSTIDAFDLYNDTASSVDHITFFKQDVTRLSNKKQFENRYDLIVADHILEHVEDVAGMINSLDWSAKSGACIHIGVPDGNNFTDIFYRLIHRYKSGGHIQQFAVDDIIELMDGISCELVQCEPWEDDWAWLERLYSLEFNQVEGVTQEQLQFLVNTFRKELTAEKGYLYGYEYVFKKL